MITAGPTYEKIDPVRFIGNFSSGKMGFALAEECAARGAEVTLIAGPVALKTSSPATRRIDVMSALEMHDAAISEFATSDVAILCAAVADYTVESPVDHKIKREKDEIPVIRLKKNPDIAKAIGEMKKPGQVTVGFALETDNEVENARGKCERKNLDFIVLNSLQNKDAGFQVDTNVITIITSDGKALEYPCKPKTEVAKDIVDVLVKDYIK